MKSNSKLSAGRVQTMSLFDKDIPALFGARKTLCVAVVGGSKDEPEIDLLRSHGIQLQITTLGVTEDSDIYFNLNEPRETKLEFDLVLCSQVLEHIFRIEVAVQNLSALLNEGGVLYISCPASNMKHASPEYFSAGYQPAMLGNLCRDNKLEVLRELDLGSERLYKMTHLFQLWPNKKFHDLPVLWNFDGSFLKLLPRIIKYAPRIILALLWSSKFDFGTHWSTETVVVAQNHLPRLASRS